MSEVTQGCEPHRKAARFGLSPNFRIMEFCAVVNKQEKRIYQPVQRICDEGVPALWQEN